MSAATLFPENSGSSDEEGSSEPISLQKPIRNGNVEEDPGFTINKNYAERYDSWRNKEELQKMKDRYGTDNLDELEKSSEESSSSEEDEWTPDQEKDFFKALANLKKKDPKIYDPEVKFFTKEEKAAAASASSNVIEAKKKSIKKEKPFLLKDHERTMILEKGGLMSSDEEDEVTGQKSNANKYIPLSYHEELADIKKGFTKALKEIDSDDEDGLANVSVPKDKLMTIKNKSEAETEQENEDYRLWLKGEMEKLKTGNLSKEEVKELGFLRSYWTDEKLDEGEKFLRDYILNRKYMEPQDEDFTPSNYNEVAHDSDEGGLSNDENFETQREEFEHKYNFRFEEPDPEFIKRFPRTIQDSLRRENESRKKAREAAKDRKIEVKERKREEVQRLKAMKRKEIVDRIAQLQEISGNPELPVDDLDIEGDFNPEEYDKKMQKIFNEQYYDESGADADKPEFPFDPEIDDEINWEEWVPTEEDDESQEDDEDEQSTTDKPEKKSIEKKIKEKEIKRREKRKETSIEELIEASKGKRGGKNKSVFLEVLEKKKPKFDPKVHKSFAKYFEEYYHLDFEDLVGDLPCRFKYRKVVPNDFGLTMEEILNAPDRELNQWASLKKTYQYRADDEEKYEAQAYQKKAENDKLKKRVLMSFYKPKSNNESEDDDQNSSDEETVPQVPTGEKKKRKKKKKKAKTNNVEVEDQIKSIKEEPTEEDEELEEEEAIIVEEEVSKPEKKQKKMKNKTESLNGSVLIKEEPELDKEETPNKSENKKNKKEGLNDSVKIKQKIEKESEILENPSEQQQTPSSAKKSKRQKKNEKKKALKDNPTPTLLKPDYIQSKPKEEEENSVKKDIKKKKSFGGDKKWDNVKGLKRKLELDVGVEDDRLKAYGLNPKKYKKWVKYGGTSQ